MSLIVESAFTDRISKPMGNVFNVSVWSPAAILKGNAGISKNPVSKTVITTFWLSDPDSRVIHRIYRGYVDNFDLPGHRILQHREIYLQMVCRLLNSKMKVQLVPDQGLIGIKNRSYGNILRPGRSTRTGQKS